MSAFEFPTRRRLLPPLDPAGKLQYRLFLAGKNLPCTEQRIVKPGGEHACYLEAPNLGSFYLTIR